ncbi:DNA polymerase IV [Neptunomonas marina]|uniref:DNA polymerase IV n=1 Tax=Neptunomonas marina TaxID=1815562 RepID=A0A437Q7Q5_9GAMM|nr:DNA polymerase IV [Neptunomonas marina]RVU30574.1 DNA polymerase IV [Neptunomonas marina]
MRKVIHCDCDCFYAAVEMRDNPALRDIPLAIGGAADRRGVIATCNYEARRFGIHSAMSTAQALKRCPALTVMRGNMEKYRTVSQQIMAIYREVTDLIEPLSLDEAYLDVSESQMFNGSATRIAEYLRRRVKEEVGITISAGVAPNKFLAKIASDWDKPDGLFVIAPQDVASFVEVLPVAKLHGVGKKTAAKLAQAGIVTCHDVLQRPLTELVDKFGVFGERLYRLSQGIDERPVQVERRRKSVSVERTYAEDFDAVELCLAQLPSLLDDLARRFDALKGAKRIQGALVKVKFADFSQTTVEQQAKTVSAALFEALMREGHSRGNGKAVRLLGIGYRLGDTEDQPQQLALW